MWRKLKFLHMWINFKFLHMTDAEKSEISFVVCTIYGILLHFTPFCCNFLAFYAVLSQNWFLRLTRYCVEKNLVQNSARGEKMTNMRYVHGCQIKWLTMLQKDITKEIMKCFMFHNQFKSGRFNKVQDWSW